MILTRLFFELRFLDLVENYLVFWVFARHEGLLIWLFCLLSRRYSGSGNGGWHELLVERDAFVGPEVIWLSFLATVLRANILGGHLRYSQAGFVESWFNYRLVARDRVWVRSQSPMGQLTIQLDLLRSRRRCNRSLASSLPRAKRGVSFDRLLRTHLGARKITGAGRCPVRKTTAM